jgi:hypothetical protein
MPDNIAFSNRFYGHKDAAWHKLGLVTQEDMNAVKVYGMLGGYTFEKRPTMVYLNGEMQDLGDFAIIRSVTKDDMVERKFGYAKKGYHIIQPLRVCELFDENVKQPVETLGMLGKGERVFLTWKLPEFDINGDEIKVFGFVACGYDALHGASLNVVTTRVVCENTWNVAINEAENTKEYGRGKVWMGRHNSPNIERDLGIWMEHVQLEAEGRANLTKNLFSKMAVTKLDPKQDKDEVYNLLFGIYPDPKKLPEYYPQKLVTEKQEKIDKGIETAEKDRDLVYSLFNGLGTAIDASAWGLFNSVTEYENWGRMTKKAPELSILLGARGNTMNRAADVIGKWIDSKQE